jgi:hypothetical protein
MPDKTPCPRCHKAGLVRLETIIKGGRSLRHYYCGACAHEWELSEFGDAPPQSNDRSAGRPDRSRA